MLSSILWMFRNKDYSYIQRYRENAVFGEFVYWNFSIPSSDSITMETIKTQQNQLRNVWIKQSKEVDLGTFRLQARNAVIVLKCDLVLCTIIDSMYTLAFSHSPLSDPSRYCYIYVFCDDQCQSRIHISLSCYLCFKIWSLEAYTYL